MLESHLVFTSHLVYLYLATFIIIHVKINSIHNDNASTRESLFQLHTEQQEIFRYCKVLFFQKL